MEVRARASIQALLQSFNNGLSANPHAQLTSNGPILANIFGPDGYDKERVKDRSNTINKKDVLGLKECIVSKDK